MGRTVIPSSELWQVTQRWLLKLGSNPSSKFSREEITSHPDYPAITSIIDFLDSGHMDYHAVQTSDSYFHKLNYPLLAHIRQEGNEYMHIIEDADDWERQKGITQHWSGIAIFPEKNAIWHNSQNTAYRIHSRKNKVFFTILTVLGLLILVYLSLRQPDLPLIAYGFFSLTGLILSIVVVATELGYSNDFVKQVCSSIQIGGCEQVLNSSYGKGFFGITAADACLSYFSTQFIVYSLSSYFVAFLPVMIMFSFLTVGVGVLSLYLQAVRLKKWCFICLGIVVIIFLQAYSAVLIAAEVMSFSLSYFVIYFFILSTLYLTWARLKSLIEFNRNNKYKAAELRKWKMDANLFLMQLQSQSTVNLSNLPNDLLFGNGDDAFTITVVCNPYCSPCAKAHHQLDKLIKRFDDFLKIETVMLCYPDKIADPLTEAVEVILQNAEALDDKELKREALADWFTWMNRKRWLEKWNPDRNIDVSHSMRKHSDWIAQNKVVSTPTFFINNKRVPSRYSVEDLVTLIPQLTEILTTKN